MLADQVATNYLRADISERQRAMLAFALKVCKDSGTLVDADYAALRGHGFSDDELRRVPIVEPGSRLKQGATPNWYKARAGIRTKALSGAARVARYRPQKLS